MNAFLIVFLIGPLREPYNRARKTGHALHVLKTALYIVCATFSVSFLIAFCVLRACGVFAHAAPRRCMLDSEELPIRRTPCEAFLQVIAPCHYMSFPW